MARKVVRSKTQRKLIAWAVLAGIITAAALYIPEGTPKFVIFVVLGAIALVAGGLLAVCSVIAFLYWVKTGFVTNPLRHGPWGDYKDDADPIRWYS